MTLHVPYQCKSKYFNRDESLRQNFRQIEEEFSKIDSEKTYADYFLINRKPRNISRTSDGNSTLPHDASLPRHTHSRLQARHHANIPAGKGVK